MHALSERRTRHRSMLPGFMSVTMSISFTFLQTLSTPLSALER
jgi:hypothetical protein